MEEDETKPKQQVGAVVICFADMVDVKPTPCDWDGCKEEADKYCCGFTEPKKGCRAKKLGFCVHHFYRHLMKEHPREARNRGCIKAKKLL
jgi:hypothetical protein